MPVQGSFLQQWHPDSPSGSMGNAHYFHHLAKKIHSCYRSAVEALAKAAGKPVKTPYEIIYTFPMPKELSKLSLEELKSCSLGYRAPYIYDTVKAAVKTPGIMKKIGTLDDEDLLKALMDFPGVGIKVAGCTALFGYGRTSFAPVDVWISGSSIHSTREKTHSLLLVKMLESSSNTFSSTPRQQN